MKRLLLFLLAVTVCVEAWAQYDTLAPKPLVPMRRIDRHTSTKAYQMCFVAFPLIVGGSVMMVYDRNFQAMRNGYAGAFRQNYDDYFQYAPAAVMVGMKAFGYKSRSSWGRMLVSDAFSGAIMATAVNSLKYSVKVMRPDGSSANSFPSGHTAMAFMTATMLHKEYGRRSPWFSIGGYTLATLVGVTRQLNNRHWMSDTMVGAGIGILATELGYFLADLIYKDRGLNFDPEAPYLFDGLRKPSFFGINVGFSTLMGRYELLPDRSFDFATGPTISLQGAWFITPYLGVGGRFGVSNMSMRIDGVAQAENLESASASGGLYLSYPISSRWLVGSKLIAGYEHFKSCQLEAGKVGSNGGGLFGTGLSMTFAAYRSLGVRFSTEYDLLPPMSEFSTERGHRLTFGLGITALF